MIASIISGKAGRPKSAKKQEESIRPTMSKVKLSGKPRIYEGPNIKRKSPIPKRLDIIMNLFCTLSGIRGASKVIIMYIEH